jgi:hypothetical protein
MLLHTLVGFSSVQSANADASAVNGKQQAALTDHDHDHDNEQICRWTPVYLPWVGSREMR